MDRMPRRVSFSLATFLLLGVIIALVLSNVITNRKLQTAQAEVESVRQNFGYIHAERADKTYVTSITKFQHSRGAKLRFHFPVDCRYRLRISEVDSSWQHDDVVSLANTEQSRDMNGLTSEDAILSYDLAYDLRKRQPILVVQSYERQDTYAPNDWQGLSQLEPKANHLLAFGDVPQIDFGTDEVIPLASFSATGCEKIVVLWLEPQQKTNSNQSK